MKQILSALALIATCGPAIAAGEKAVAVINDPVAFVKGVYTHWSTSKPEPEGIFTARLTALQALDEKEAHGEVGRGNDFSYWCNCQDGEIKKSVVTGRNVENTKVRKVVDVKYEIDGKKQEEFFYFEQTKDGWKLDDVRMAGKDGWTLSLIYKFGWDDEK